MHAIGYIIGLMLVKSLGNPGIGRISLILCGIGLALTFTCSRAMARNKGVPNWLGWLGGLIPFVGLWLIFFAPKMPGSPAAVARDKPCLARC